MSTETIQYEGSFAGLGTTLDITDILHTQERLKQLAQAMEQMDEMVRITDNNGYITYVNEALSKHTGYKKSEIIGSQNELFKSGKHDANFYKKMYETIQSKQSYQATFINAKKDGKTYYEDQIITPILNEESDEIEYFVSTSKDITEHVEMQKKLKSLATIDVLTGIKNRYSLGIEIENEIRRVKRYKSTFVLMMFDIDFFKKVNDTYGHDIGDDVLKKFSFIVSQSVRDTDTFGRWGGEEFVMLLPGTKQEETLRLVNKLRQQIETCGFHYHGESVKITISCGVSSFNENDTLSQVFERADKSLYNAKDNGRNQCVVASCLSD